MGHQSKKARNAVRRGFGTKAKKINKKIKKSCNACNSALTKKRCAFCDATITHENFPMCPQDVSQMTYCKGLPCQTMQTVCTPCTNTGNTGTCLQCKSSSAGVGGVGNGNNPRARCMTCMTVACKENQVDCDFCDAKGECVGCCNFLTQCEGNACKFKGTACDDCSINCKKYRCVDCR